MVIDFNVFYLEKIGLCISGNLGNSRFLLPTKFT